MISSRFKRSHRGVLDKTYGNDCVASERWFREKVRLDCGSSAALLRSQPRLDSPPGPSPPHSHLEARVKIGFSTSVWYRKSRGAVATDAHDLGSLGVWKTVVNDRRARGHSRSFVRFMSMGTTLPGVGGLMELYSRTSYYRVRRSQSQIPSCYCLDLMHVKPAMDPDLTPHLSSPRSFSGCLSFIHWFPRSFVSLRYPDSSFCMAPVTVSQKVYEGAGRVLQAAGMPLLISQSNGVNARS